MLETDPEGFSLHPEGEGEPQKGYKQERVWSDLRFGKMSMRMGYRAAGGEVGDP